MSTGSVCTAKHTKQLLILASSSYHEPRTPTGTKKTTLDSPLVRMKEKIDPLVMRRGVSWGGHDTVGFTATGFTGSVPRTAPDEDMPLTADGYWGSMLV
jgi:hypothetical protein